MFATNAFGLVIQGREGSYAIGRSVSSAGDVNGDGLDDLIIGGSRTYVIFGGGALVLGGSLDVADLDGGNGFFFDGVDPGEGHGRSVSNAGDVNGDGIGDVIIGAPRADPNSKASAGASYVVFGGHEIGTDGSFDLAELNGRNGFIINGATAFDGSGRSVSNAGDINGDGFDDLIIGAPSAKRHGNYYQGESYVVLGGPGVGGSGSLDLVDLDGRNGFAIRGIAAFDYSGTAVSTAGDVNADGYDDLVIGSPGPLTPSRDNDALGDSYVVFGAREIGKGGAIDLGSLDGKDGFVVPGVDPRNRAYGVDTGRSVSEAGDVNGDGIDDLIIGAPYGGSFYFGESYVILGSRELGQDGTFYVRSRAADSVFISGSDWFSGSGSAVSYAGDINGDGFDDLIIGEPGARENGRSSGGSFVVLGGESIDQYRFGAYDRDGARAYNFIGADPADAAGASVSNAGDMNGDGIDDFMIGAPGADPDGMSGAGEAYVVFGGTERLAELDALDGASDGQIQLALLGAVVLDFATDAERGPLTAGTILTDQFTRLGLTIASAEGDAHPAMIFDSANPTGGDVDLGTANEAFGGAGVGAGGQSNTEPLGNLLIISEDGDTSDPDDNADGGTLIFTFDTPVTVFTITLVDIDDKGGEATGTVQAFDADGELLASVLPEGLGDNSVQTLRLGVAEVSALHVQFVGSGAIADLSFLPTVEADVLT